MARNTSVMFIGIGGHVVAIDSVSGTELWRTKLKSQTLVTIHESSDRIYAAAMGELFCLDSASGEILWKNKLKGLGMGTICFGGDSSIAGAAAAAAASAAAAT